jgi:hypothetical protein
MKGIGILAVGLSNGNGGVWFVIETYRVGGVVKSKKQFGRGQM